jgi:hypothetical protein
VARLRLDEQVTSALAELQAVLPPTEFSAELFLSLAKHYRPGVAFATAFAGWIDELLADQRRSPRRVPGQRHDVKVELGHRSIEGIVYNISEHGLGIAVLTAQDDAAARLHVEAAVAIIGDHGRAQGRIASQYPAAGGCVLGIELQERLVLPGLPAVEA